MSLCLLFAPVPQFPALARDTQFDSMPPVVRGGYFAFARIRGELFLVQVSSNTPAPSALTTVDVKIFRHEFVTIFRLLDMKTLHPSDISIIERIDECHTRYEEENGTVFLAREPMTRLQKLSRPPPVPGVYLPVTPRTPSRYSAQFSRQR